jgi:hypothetical protein
MDAKPNCFCAGMGMIIHAIIVVLIIFILWRLFWVEHLVSNPRNYIGHGLPDQIYTSGADQRFAQVFTSTDEGV